MFKSICVEMFGTGSHGQKYGARPDGLCGREAEFVVSIMGEPWGPKCARCVKFYAAQCRRPMTEEMDAKIADLQDHFDPLTGAPKE